ncbi:MAG TPA: hypothetical protein DEH02_20155 [Bacteroidales bacterium]|nr:MAG: hypothetical protein A2X01_16920 [Bacteroidetes bacterium GWF2_35_48]HBX53378.1 hypothetical protein [Bacteroidales bacterium]
MQLNYLKNLTAILFFIFLFSAVSNAQESFVQVSGSILNLEKKPIKGASVNVLLENKVFKSVKTGRKGDFAFELPHSKDFIIEGTKRGFVTKKIKFSTKVPQKETKGFMWEYELSLQIFENIEGLDVSPLKEPVAAVKYNKSEEEFDYDQSFYALVKPKLDAMAKQMLELRNKHYEKNVAMGAELMKQNKLEEAWACYYKADELKPESKEPDKKIKEIKKLLTKNSSIDELYKNAISSADHMASKNKLNDALKDYEKAMLYRPEDMYASNKIHEMEKLIASGTVVASDDNLAENTTTTTVTANTSAPPLNDIKEKKVTAETIIHDNDRRELIVKRKIDSCLIVLNAREKSGNKKEAVEVINVLAELYLSIGDFDAANDYYDRALRLNQDLGDKVAISKTLNNLGVVSDNAASPDKALAYFQTSLEVKKDMKDKDGMAKIYYRMAKVYYKKRDLKRAIEYMEKSCELDAELKNEKEVALSDFMIGNIYYEMRKFSESEDRYNSAFAVFERLNMKKEKAALLNNIGNVFFSKGNLDKALESYNASMSLKESLSNKSGVSASLHNIGYIYINKKDINKAIWNFNRSVLLARTSSNNVVLARGYFAFNEVYTQQKEHQKALEYFKLYSSISQIVQGADIEGQIIENLVKYEGDAITKDSELSLLKGELIKQKLYSQAIALKNEAQNAEMARLEALMKQNRMVQYFSFGGLAVFLFFFIILLLNYRRLKKAFKVIKAHEKVIEAQKQEIETQRDFVIKQGDRIASQNVRIKEQRDFALIQAKEINDSVNYAKHIQSALLQPDDEVIDALPDHFVLFKPKKVVSGDFYWIKNLKYNDSVTNANRNLFIIVVADCTGPGVPGAVMSMLGVALVNEIYNKIIETQAFDQLRTDLILNQLRDKFIKSLHLKGREGENKDGMDVAIVIYDVDKKLIQFSAANHPLYIVRKPLSPEQQYTLDEIKADKIPIGMYLENIDNFSKHDLQLAKGDTFYLFSDGYSDQFGGSKGKKFLLKQFKDMILDIQLKSIDEQRIHINQSFEEWKGVNEQVDDVTIFALKV